jgi:hypothetical protein
MAAGSTYTPISTQTLGSATASVTFSSIPSTYTDLMLVSSITNSSAGSNYSLSFRFNGDTGSNYSNTYLYGNGSSATSGRESGTFINIGNTTFTSGTFSPMTISIQNYANTTTYKTIIGRGNNVGAYVMAAVGLWRSTTAITSITIAPEFTVNWNAGSTFTLYGIQAA